MDRSDWLKWRKFGIGASDVPSIMMVSPYRTILDVYDDKTSDLIEEKSNYIMELGNKMEPIARSRYELLHDSDFPAANFVNATTHHYRCSLDGYNKELNKAIEIKYVGKNFFNECPAKYYPQIQYQYAVTMCESIDLVQINNMNEIHITTVPRDGDYIIKMIDRVDWFWDCVTNLRRDKIVACIPRTPDPLEKATTIAKIALEQAIDHRSMSSLGRAMNISVEMLRYNLAKARQLDAVKEIINNRKNKFKGLKNEN